MGEHFDKLEPHEQVAVKAKAWQDWVAKVVEAKEKGHTSWTEPHKDKYLEDKKEEIAQNPDAVKQLVESHNYLIII